MKAALTSRPAAWGSKGASLELETGELALGLRGRFETRGWSGRGVIPEARALAGLSTELDLMCDCLTPGGLIGAVFANELKLPRSSERPRRHRCVDRMGSRSPLESAMIGTR